ncbi:Rossmann-like domain-containing protein [Desulfoscipio gibsoniae]|uniref:Putative heavy-metal chelation domain-containing protein n=1 Tax=Desulfoscipio gibsoniae DSM 7213 TaxID=767817 RepID=R4KCU3_9FIRM|nr:DUF364 domain-containing protein [Desulfoscipio gibsoniae]AGL00404.1 hypothetical protein Desgi_0855 [Desulfoscipio gibsoniae DSM 7213]
MSLLEEAREKLRVIIDEAGLHSGEAIDIVSTRDLTAKEAIGRPDRTDFPLLKGKEVMMQATYRDCVGQAFTDQPAQFHGTLEEVLRLTFDTNHNRAVFVATLNAVMRYLGKVQGTDHCKDKEPRLCARQLPEYITQHYGQPKIAFVGYQPAMIEELVKHFKIKVSDLDPDNIGREKLGVLISGPDNTAKNIDWADIVLTTGTVLVNDTLAELERGKPVIFYGVTIAGLAALFSLPRVCFYGR